MGGKLNCLCGRRPMGFTWGITPAVSEGRLSKASIEKGFCERKAECTFPEGVAVDVKAELSPPGKN